MLYFNRIIGYFVDMPTENPCRQLWCTDCAWCYDLTLDKLTAVYRINIGIYSQVCNKCGKLLVDGVKKADGAPLSLFD